MFTLLGGIRVTLVKSANFTLLKRFEIRCPNHGTVWTMAWHGSFTLRLSSWKMTTIACLLAECVYPYLQVAGWWVDCRWSVLGLTMWGVCGCWFCVSCWAHSPGASFVFLYRWGPAPAGWPLPVWESQLRFAPGEWAWDETWIGSYTRLTWSSCVSRLGGLLVIWHFLTCRWLFPPWRSSNHSSTVCNRPCWNGWLHSNSTKMPFLIGQYFAKEPRFRHSFANVSLIPSELWKHIFTLKELNYTRLELNQSRSKSSDFSSFTLRVYATTWAPFHKIVVINYVLYLHSLPYLWLI